jgi:hypothetical protein
MTLLGWVTVGMDGVQVLAKAWVQLWSPEGEIWL